MQAIAACLGAIVVMQIVKSTCVKLGPIDILDARLDNWLIAVGVAREMGTSADCHLCTLGL
jgi:hypothetical protein